MRPLAGILFATLTAMAPACGRDRFAADGTARQVAPAPALDGFAVNRAQPFRLADAYGQVVVLTFGYTSCADACPETFRAMRGLFRALGRDADDVLFLYVTVDPERDRPDALRAFVRAVDPRFEGLFVEGDTLSRLLERYGVVARKRVPDPRQYAQRETDAAAFYSMDHSTAYFVIDRRGNLRARLEHEAPAEAVERAVRSLLAEPGPRPHRVADVDVRVLPSGVGAVYLRIDNEGTDADRLTRIDVDGALGVELHETVKQGDVTTMRHRPEGFDLPPRGSLVFSSGGRHAMLFGLRDAATRTHVDLTLHFAHAPARRLAAQVHDGMAAPAPAPTSGTSPKLRVCADPNAMPYSNERREGFENALAAMVAADLGREVEYTWSPQRRGFFRRTLNANECDVVMGVPTALDMVRTTVPYYTSGYVLVRGPNAPEVRSFDDPRLRNLRIGVPVVGDDGANPPPVLALGQRQLTSNLRGYSVYGDYREESPPADPIRALRRGEVDVVVAWGPVAGYYATKTDDGADAQVKLSLAVLPESEAPAGLTYRFPMSMAVRRDDEALVGVLNGVLSRRANDVAALLDRYGIPRL